MKIERFLAPQAEGYPAALVEITAGRKRSHWMWFVFPQLRGLGKSTIAWYYGIEDLAEAGRYWHHPVLGPRLREITTAVLTLPETDPERIFGWPDVMKLRSCMTLFWEASHDPLFAQVIEKYYQGQWDPATQKLLGKETV